MAQDKNPPIKLSVHESSDPSLISPNADIEPSSNLNDLNDSSHDDENVDIPTPALDDADQDKHTVSQTTIANISAG